MLGNDLLGFHTQYHCNNFLETVDRALECRIDRERFAVTRGGRRPASGRSRSASIPTGRRVPRRRLGSASGGAAGSASAGDRPLLVGVDRVDYTKGIPERLRAVDRLLRKHPELKGTFHFVQVGHRAGRTCRRTGT